MTTAVAPARERTRFRLAVSPHVLAPAALVAFAAALALLGWNSWGDLGSDTGYDLVAAERLAGGQLPYADFVYYYGPLSPALLAVLVWLGLAPLTAAVVLGLGLAGLVVAGTYLLARTQVGPLGAFLAAALVLPLAFAPNNFSFVLPHTFSVTVGLCSALGFLLAVRQYAAVGLTHWLVAAGTAAGLATLTRPEFVAAVALAAVAWLVLRARRGTARRREVVLFGLPALGFPAVVYGGFLTQVSLGTLLFENLYPVDELRAAGSTLLRSHAPLTAASFAELGAKLALYSAGLGLLVLAARVIERGGWARRVALALAGVTGIAATAASFARPETLRYGLEYAYGWIPAGVVVAVVVLTLRTRRAEGAGSPSLQTAVACALVLFFLAAEGYHSFLIHAPSVQPAVYAFPLAAVLLARLHLRELARTRAAYTLGAAWLVFLSAAGIGLTLKDAREDSSTVQGARGSIRATSADAPVYQAALDAIESRSRPGETVLVAPQLTTLYSLSGRTDPLPQISLLPGALPTPADERAAIAELVRQDVKLIVLDTRSFPEYGHSSFGVSFDRELAAWIRARFELTRTHVFPGGDGRQLQIWTRRTA